MNEIYGHLGIKLERKEHKVYVDSPFNFLMEQSIAKGQGSLSKHGALVVNTGQHTGRSAKDKYVVKAPSTEKSIWWQNDINQMTPETFARLKDNIINYLNEDRDIYITERSVGAHETHNLEVCLVTSHPSHALFSKYLFRPPQRSFEKKDFVILHAPDFVVDPNEYDTRSGTIIVTCFDTNITIIVGTLYAGEIKKSMFSVMNYLLPTADILPMHSGCSQLSNGDVSVFFGLSGTGKTTLSTDQGTSLIGDDEHGLSDEGVFNFEGGCYAKTFRLSHAGEPAIFDASTRFGSLLENVIVTGKTGEVDFFDKSISENGRSSYPLRFIKDCVPTSKGKIPQHIFFLSADAFGILPPIAKLSVEQSMFYFVLGYTAKLAGTEIGVKEPQATFSSCFGAPFMLRHPSVYAELLGTYLKRHDIKVWLINTGWTSGGYAVGHRFPLNITRQIIRGVQSNTLNKIPTDRDPIFGFEVPHAVKSVPTSLLHPEKGWTSKADYQKNAKDLAIKFHQQMKKFPEFYERHRQGAPIHCE